FRRRGVTASLPSLIGWSLSGCLIAWPLVFATSKKSLRLSYHWTRAIAGLVLTVAINSGALLGIGILTQSDPTSRTDHGLDLLSIFNTLVLPVLSSLAVASSMAFFFNRPRGESS